MTATNKEFEEWRAVRNKAFATLDMDYARRVMPAATDDSVRLMALHKARYDCADLAPELRHASGHWLRERGLGSTMGPLLREGEIPA